MPAVGVIVAVAGAQEVTVVESVDAAPGLAVIRRCADLAEALAVARAGLGAVAVVDLQPRLDRDVVHAFRLAGVALLGVAADDESRAALAALGIDVVAGDVGQACLAARARPEPGPLAPVDFEPAPPPGGMIVAVWGTAGAPGRTTVAVTIAAELAREGYRALAVDLDTYGASIATVLGLEDESAGVAAVAHGAVRGGGAQELVERHSVLVSERLSVLTGLARASRWAELSDAALDALWPALRAVADVVVVDIAAPVEADLDSFGAGGGRDGATRAALDQADAVVVVGGAEPHQVVRLVTLLSTMEGPPPVVAVNRIRSSVAGPHPEEAIAAILARHTTVTEVWPLPWDQRSCDEALLQGRTLAEAAPRSPLRKAIRALALAITADARAGSVPAAVPVGD